MLNIVGREIRLFGLRNKIFVIKYLTEYVSYLDSSNSPAEKRLELFITRDIIGPLL